MTIKEEIKFALEDANKDIDLMPEQEEYMRGYLGGQLSIVRIIEKHFGKFINDEGFTCPMCVDCPDNCPLDKER